MRKVILRANHLLKIIQPVSERATFKLGLILLQNTYSCPLFTSLGGNGVGLGRTRAVGRQEIVSLSAGEGVNRCLSK